MAVVTSTGTGFKTSNSGGTWTQFGASDAYTMFVATYGAAGTVPTNTALTVAGVFDLNGTAQTVNTLAGSGLVTNSGANPASLTVNTGNFSGNANGNLGVIVNLSLIHI